MAGSLAGHFLSTVLPASFDQDFTSDLSRGNQSSTVLQNLSEYANYSYEGSMGAGMSGSWGWWLLQLGTPIIVLVGIPGNVLSFLIMKSRRFRSKSYSHYLCTLAVFDSLVLIGKYIRRVDQILLSSGQPGIIDSFGDAACKIHNFAEHICYLMSSWLVLCMTLERFIAVNFPFKKDTFCRPRNAVTVILVVFAIMSYSQIFRLIIIEHMPNVGCGAPDRYRHIYVVLHVYMYQLVLQFMLPAVLILVCNLLILVKIRRLRYSLPRHYGNCRSNSTVPYSKRHKTTCMLLIVSFTYVIALLPLVLISLIIHISSIVNIPLATKIFYKVEDLVMFLELISEMNYGINFYIYVMSGAQFRYELRHICSRRYAFISSPAPTEKVFQFRKTGSNS